MPDTDGEQVMVDPRLSELAQRSPTFGFLLQHEAVLVGYGAAAEALVFSDPNTSMIKARQFGEQLVAALVTSFGIRLPAGRTSQHKRLDEQVSQATAEATARREAEAEDSRRLAHTVAVPVRVDRSRDPVHQWTGPGPAQPAGVRLPPAHDDCPLDP